MILETREKGAISIIKHALGIFITLFSPFSYIFCKLIYVFIYMFIGCMIYMYLYVSIYKYI
jgi:hypothetical protein